MSQVYIVKLPTKVKMAAPMHGGLFCSIMVETSTIADARHQEENPMRKKCLKAIVQEGHNICTSEWQKVSAILKANTV